MKVECKEVKFTPIVLTIESQMELDVLSELVSLVGTYRIPQDVQDFASELTDRLLDMGATSGYVYFCDEGSRLVAK